MKSPLHRLLLLALGALVCSGDLSAAPKPNVVFILADDLGYSDVGCYGGEIQTPQLDKLAAGGVRFTQFYNTARCWPSRAALLTGYYAQQVNRDPQGERPKWAALLPELLKGAGYRSYHSGKWHVDGQVLAGGFEHSYLLLDHNRNFYPRNHELDDKPLPPVQPGDGYYTTTAMAQHALEWLAGHEREHKAEPFFLYLAFTTPHFPLQAPAEDISRYQGRYDQGWDSIRAERWARMRKAGLVAGGLSAPEPSVIPGWNASEAELRKQIGPGETGHAGPWGDMTSEEQRFQARKMEVHAAMVDRIDREVGRVIDQIKAMGVFENTLILFASDNGASAEQIIRGDGHTPGATPGSGESYLGLGPGWSTVSNTPFRKHKSWTHEGGIATPLIAHWPAGIAAHGELRHAPGHLVDIAPTLLELAGVTPPVEWNNEARPALPGRSLVPAFAAEIGTEHAPIFFKHQDNRALRAGNWKIAATGKDGAWELYDLTNDRAESHNLAAEQPGKLTELSALWTQLDAEYAKQGATGGRLPKGRKGEQ